MRGPQRDPTIQEKLQRWVKDNPDRWYTARFIEVHAETGVSEASINRYLPLHIAKAAKILPSEVKQKRRETIGFNLTRLSDAEIAKIQQLFNEGHEALDISYLLNRGISTVEKYRPK